MKLSVTTIPALHDNFIYIVEYEKGHAFVVDPGESAFVGAELHSRGLLLTRILVTHHHYDHLAGVAELKKRWPCKVIGPDTCVPDIDVVAEEMPLIPLGKRKIEIILTPGHTTTAICYYIPPLTKTDKPMLFTGDTMFIGGCGKILESTPEALYNSLQKLASLPEETLLYPGHNYTEENYEFALTVNPKNQAVQEQLDNIKKSSKPPSTIAREKQTNVFIMAKNAANFAKLRKKKDVF